MFRMLEVVGRSEKSFSEAVKSAVEEMISSGEKVHFFEVIEQRGAVREGKFKEFQVKVKIAVEMKKEKHETPGQHRHEGDVCPTCGKETGPEGHLCVPVEGEDKTCDWCGALIADERHLCGGKVEDLTYICNSCGRTAVKAEHLCQPQKIEKNAER